MKIINSLKWRYAVKKFNSEKYLTEDKVKLLQQAFNLTATSYGLQPIKLVVLQNKKIQEKLVEHSHNQLQILQASHVFIICVPKTFTVEEVSNYFKLVKEIRNTPDEITAPFKEYMKADIEQRSPEFLFQWNKNQAYIALGNLLTVCALEQIDSCPMEGFIPEKYDEILSLSKHNLQSVLVLPVGYRANDDYMKDLQKVRKPLEEMIIKID